MNTFEKYKNMKASIVEVFTESTDQKDARKILEPDSGVIDKFREKWESDGVKNSAYHNKSTNKISLSLLVVPKHKQRQGIGSQYMKELSSHADKLGATVTLTPSSDFGGSKTGLSKFYKSHDFVENKGKNKDFTISDSMYRIPKQGQ